MRGLAVPGMNSIPVERADLYSIERCHQVGRRAKAVGCWAGGTAIRHDLAEDHTLAMPYVRACVLLRRMAREEGANGLSNALRPVHICTTRYHPAPRPPSSLIVSHPSQQSHKPSPANARSTPAKSPLSRKGEWIIRSGPIVTLHRYGYCISRSGLDLVLAALSCEPQMPTRSSRSTSDGRLQGIPAPVFGRHALPVPPSCQCMISCGRRIAGAAQPGDMSSRPTINTLWGPFAVSSIFSRCRGTVVTIWRVFVNGPAGCSCICCIRINFEPGCA